MARPVRSICCWHMALIRMQRTRRALRLCRRPLPAIGPPSRRHYGAPALDSNGEEVPLLAFEIDGGGVAAADEHGDALVRGGQVPMGAERCQRGGAAGFRDDAQVLPQEPLRVLNGIVRYQHGGAHGAERWGIPAL